MAFFEQNEDEPVTALFDEDGNQIFETIGILSLSVGQTSVFAEHTLEDGTVVSDNKIILQGRVNGQVVLDSADYVEVYKKLKDAYINTVRFTVQTRVDSYDNMYLESLPYEESSKISGTIAMAISFVEQQFVEVKTGTLPPAKVKAPQNADTVDSGTKLPQSNQTTLQKISSSLGGLF